MTEEEKEELKDLIINAAVFVAENWFALLCLGIIIYYIFIR